MRKTGLAIIAFLSLATAAFADDQQAQALDAPAKDYPRLEVAENDEGVMVPTTWTRVSEDEWRAAPDDPASPRYIEILHGPDPIDPARALEEAAKRAGVELSGASTYEITTAEITFGGKGYVTAATAGIGGVEQSIFVLTSYSMARGVYGADFFAIPAANYREWGGVAMYLDVMGVTPYLDGLPEGFAEAARFATNAQQAEIFAGLLDHVTMRMKTATMQAQAGALRTMQGINRALQTQAECYQLSYCNYNWTTGEAEYNGE